MRRTALRCGAGTACVIAGQSHTWALGSPRVHPDGGVGIVPHPDDERFVCLAGPEERDPQYFNEVVALSKVHPIALAWRGNQHYASFMFATTPAFDFALASRPDLPVDEAVVLVPELALRAYFEPSLDHLAGLLKEMREVAGPGVIVVGTPPPRGNLQRLRQALVREPFFVNITAALGCDVSTIALAPELLHLKMWLVMQDMMRTLAETHGMPFCPCPADALTPKGFLREDLWADDMTHANCAYGALMLRDLAALMVSMRTA
jgi:hypothetical protein